MAKEYMTMDEYAATLVGGNMKAKGMAKGGKVAKMAGGGMMKKKGYKKGGAMKSKGMKRGGAMKRSKGGTVRGAGAATRGKRFGRSA